MPADPPKTKKLAPDDFEFSPEELEKFANSRALIEQEDGAEFDRRIDRHQAQRAARGMLPTTELAKDLRELKNAIINTRLLRDHDEEFHDTYPFDEYEVFDCVTGGMGMILEARDPGLDRKVAIKMWVKADPEAEGNLRAEALTLARLQHPNVVTVYRIGRWNDRLFFVMEWVEGQDGQKWIANDNPGWREVRDKFVAAGRGLAAAHAAKIQHRDFKPSNILIGDDGRVLVADFGIADSLHSSEPDAISSSLAGTKHFIAPERLMGMRGDARSDQFSFCVSLWVGLHRQAPYPGRTEHALLEAMEAGRISPVAASSKVPHWLSRVVRKGLAMRPEDRHHDMNALIEALTDDPPVGDHSEGGVGEGEDFETVGMMNAPAGEGVTVTISATTRTRRRERRLVLGGTVLGGVVASMATALVLALMLKAPESTRSLPRVQDSTTEQLLADSARVLEAAQLLGETEEWRGKYQTASKILARAIQLETDKPKAARDKAIEAQRHAAWLENHAATAVGLKAAEGLLSETLSLSKRVDEKDP